MATPIQIVDPFAARIARTDEEAFRYFSQRTAPDSSSWWYHNYSILSSQKYPDRASAAAEIWRHPGPGADYPNGVKSGQKSTLPTWGPIVTYVNPNTGTTFNVTLPGHRLYPGFVMRFPLENSANKWQILTVGVGSGWPGFLSSYGAPFVWKGDSWPKGR